MTNSYKQIAIIVVMFLALYAGLFYGIIKPRIQVFKERYNTLSEIQSKLASLNTKKESLIKLNKDRKRIEAALQNYQNILPEGKQTSDFLIQIEGGSRETGNILQSITLNEASKPKTTQKTEEETTTSTNKNKSTETSSQSGTESTKKSPYKTIVVSMQIDGNFQQLLSFLTLSETLSRFINFSSIAITGGQDGSIKNKLDGEIYYR